MKCEYGLCIVCEKDLMIACATCGHKRPGNEYSEVLLKLSNGSLMPIVACHAHKDTLHNEDREKIMEAVQLGWRKEHDKLHWSKEKRDDYHKHFGQLKIVDHNA